MEENLSLPRCNFSILVPNTKGGEDIYMCGLSNKEECYLEYEINNCPFYWDKELNDE